MVTGGLAGAVARTFAVAQGGGGRVVLESLKHDGGRGHGVPVPHTVPRSLQRLSPPRLVLVIRVVLLVLDTQTFCFIYEWLLFVLLQQPANIQRFMIRLIQKFIQYKHIME